MKKLILLFCLAFAYTGYGAEQVYFKIAINENDYSTFLTDRISTRKSTLQYLATKMRQPSFHPESLDRNYYEVIESRGIKYFEKNVVQYDVVPIFKDRFRHLLLVDEIEGVVIRKEVYDVNGKLVFAFTSLERTAENIKPELQRTSAEPIITKAFKGYSVMGERKLKDGTRHISFSDGLNRFSVFRKKIQTETADQKRILYGNYVMRKSIGKELFTVVGTLPFKEMELLIENIVKLEDNR